MELDAGHEVTVGTVAALLERRPVVRCPEGHRLPPERAVAAAMATTEDTIVRARGRLLRGDVCGGCGAPLSMPARRSTRSVTVEAEDPIPVVTLTFDLPLTRCPACGLDQVPSRSQEDLVVAVPAAYAGRS